MFELDLFGFLLGCLCCMTIYEAGGYGRQVLQGARLSLVGEQFHYRLVSDVMSRSVCENIPLRFIILLAHINST